MPSKKSMLTPPEREEYVVGSIVKAGKKIYDTASRKARQELDKAQGITSESPGRTAESRGAVIGKDRTKAFKNTEQVVGGAKTAAVVIPATAIATAWMSKDNKGKPPSEFEKAFSKAHNAGKETFMFKGKKYTTDVRKGKSEGGLMKKIKQKIMSLLAQKEQAANEEEKEKIQMQLNSFSEEDMREALKEENTPEEGLFDNNNRISQEPKKIRLQRADGGSMLVPPEMPVDTYTPEEQAMAEETQVSDAEMEDDYMGYVLGESLDNNEQEYLMGALESDPRLSEIFDKVVMTASEFSGAGKVEGPGDGVSDSIPARLSDGEFVITEKATNQLGADNLQTMMDAAEREADYKGGYKLRKAIGGLLAKNTMPEEDEKEMQSLGLPDMEKEINKSMLGANRMPSISPFA